MDGSDCVEVGPKKMENFAPLDLNEFCFSIKRSLLLLFLLDGEFGFVFVFVLRKKEEENRVIGWSRLGNQRLYG